MGLPAWINVRLTTGAADKHPAAPALLVRPEVWIGLGFVRQTLAVGIEERLQRQDPRVTFRSSPTRPVDSNGEMDVWDAP